MTKKIAAFSLLEIALTIMISGIAISFVMPIWKVITVSKKIRLNEEKFHYIRLAMQSYLLQHGYLPNAASNLEGIAQQEIVRGYIPYKTLGIKKDFAFDANNKPFSFAVNKNLIKLENVVYKPMIANIYYDEPNFVSFCRLSKGSYTTKDNRKFITDNICNLENLIILDKGKSVVLENDYVFSMQPMYLNDDEALKKWYQNKNNEDQKMCNTIAWLIISHGQNVKKKKLSTCQIMNQSSQQQFCLAPEETDNGLFNDCVFYQTRFDMAAQANCPCTIETTRPRM